MAKKRSRQVDLTYVQKKSQAALRELLSMDPYGAGITEADLRAARRKLAKTANQRLVRLERATSEVTGEAYSSYGAAELAQEYLGDRRRYSEQLGYGDMDRVRRDIVSLQTFIASKSSTVAGQKQIERARIKAFSVPKIDPYTGEVTRHPIASASNKDFYDFLHSSLFTDMTGQFSSDQIIELYDAMRKEEAKQHEKVITKMADAFDEYMSDRSKFGIKDLEDILGVAPITGRY